MFGIAVVAIVVIIAFMRFFKSKRTRRASVGGSTPYNASYHTARTTGSILSFAGWLVVVGGGIGVVVGIITAVQGGQAGMVGGSITAGLSVITAVVGLILVAFGQVVRASVDTANRTGQIVELLRSLNPRKMVYSEVR
ncbi:MAG: hypothetical protein ABFS45_14990 [Pseudomonadota bacterium]